MVEFPHLTLLGEQVVLEEEEAVFPMVVQVEEDILEVVLMVDMLQVVAVAHL